MNELARDQLRQIVAKYGPAVGDDPQRLEGLLRDLCPGLKRETHTLVGAARERVPADLAAAQSGSLPAVAVARLTTRLQDNLGLSEEAARWAVESWALALGVVAAGQFAGTPAAARPGGPSPILANAPPISLEFAEEVDLPRARDPAPRETTECPFCNGRVSAAAKKCKHCGETLDVTLRAAEEAKHAARSAKGGININHKVHVHPGNGGERRRPYGPPPFNHLLHVLLTLFTCGAWLPIYLLVYLLTSQTPLMFLGRLARTLVVLAILGVGSYFGYMGVRSRALPYVTNTVDREMTNEKLQKIAVALQTYHDRHGRLPPPVLRDPDGQPYSWRVAILPYLGEGPLYDSYNRKEPWDSEKNRAVLARMPKWYAAPVRTAPGPNMTYFQAIVGPGTAFDGDIGRLIPDDFPDGTARTILVAEATEAVAWTKPVDLVYEPGQPLPKLGGDPGEIRFALVDGTTRALPKSTEDRVLRALITRNGGEVLAPGDLP